MEIRDLDYFLACCQARSFTAAARQAHMIDTDAVRNWFALPRLQVGESTLTPDGKATQAVLEIDTRGLEGAWIQLSATCAAPPSSAKHMIDLPGPPNAPAL